MTTTPRPQADRLQRIVAVSCAAALAIAFGGCASPLHKAPVEDRSAPRTQAAGGAAVVAADAAKLPAGAENAGKPGYYTVKPGDTMIRIGLDSGQNWRDVARWNNIDNPNLLEVGQVLRVAPPGSDPAITAARPVASTRVDARPLDSVVTAPASAAGAASAAAAGIAPATAIAAPASAPSAPSSPPVSHDDDVAWGWPAAGAVVMPFDEVKSKGLVLGGKAGDAVLAAGDGRVIYVGSGVRGYGNLVIIKHNATYLTAYAHNQTLLVKEDQVVRRGQKIAEMGSSDAERVQLHFEIRRLGKPVDPARLLPPR